MTPLPNLEFTTLNYTVANKLAAAAFNASALSVSKADPNPVAQSDHRPPHLGRTVHPDQSPYHLDVIGRDRHLTIDAINCLNPRKNRMRPPTLDAIPLSRCRANFAITRFDQSCVKILGWKHFDRDLRDALNGVTIEGHNCRDKS
jgi:hypothetical protein